MRFMAKDGYSTMEMTATLFVLTVGLFGALQLFSFGLDRMRALDESSVAMQAVQNEIEVLRAAPFASLTDGEHAFVSEAPELSRLENADTRVVIAPVAGVSAALKEVTATIVWISENGRRSERTLTTLLTEKAP